MYYDYECHKDIPFTQSKWEQVGMNICKAIRQYFESVEQYEEYLKLRNAEQEYYRKGKIEKIEKMQRVDKVKVGQIKNKKVAAKDLKLFKLYD